MEKELWYRQPAAYWNEALPLGNGRMGAMVFGGIEKEHIQINEDSVWYGRRVDRLNPDAASNVKKVQQLILDDRVEEAERLALCALSGTPESQRQYQNLGDIYIDFYGLDKTVITQYKRTLDLEKGIAAVEYSADDTTFRREVFVSYLDQIMVIFIKAEGKQTLNGTAGIVRGRFYDRSWAEDDSTIAIDGSTGEGGIRFCAAMRGSSDDGEVWTIGDQILFKDAKEILLCLSAETSFRVQDPVKTCMGDLSKVGKTAFSELRARHIEDHSKYFNRLVIELEGECCQGIPTDERLVRIQKGMDDYGMIALYLQFGRYLMMASSRPGSLPANLQGIWCNEYMPIWDSKYTININTEMNYWPVESGNLSEMHEPLFELIKRMVENGKRTAREMYGCKGFVAHHNTDLYGDTDPQDKCITSTFWLMGGAWLCLHIWTHFLYTKDEVFLEKYFDCIEQSAIFFIDFLVCDKENHMVVVPTLSPENSYIGADGRKTALTYGTSMDSEILTELFHAYLEGSKILGKEIEEEQVMHILERLPKPQIGKEGQLLEWIRDYEEYEKGHRHLSHLFGLYPAYQFTYEDTPELMKACETTIYRRLENGSGYTGWSRAWITCFWARLRNGNNVYENLKALLCESTFINLMDNHPCVDERGEYKVFQIDGNAGAAAAIMEMFVQSYPDRLYLMPALPDCLKKGHVKGIKIMGGAEISLQWEEGMLVKCSIYSLRDDVLRIHYRGKENTITVSKEKTVTLLYNKETNSLYCA
ncbi:MAG: glycosyl hydrolase family 95 catalytic domain-containing protein [Oliverpabstia sp.]